MPYQVQQSTTAYPLMFFMVDSTDHITGKTGLTCTVTLSKNGGSFASPSGSVTEVANGWYKVAGNATDSATLGPLALHATGTGADPSDTLYEVVAWDLANGRAGLNFASITGYAAGPFFPTAVVESGTAQSVTGTTLVMRSAAAFADSELVGATVVIRSATTGAGQRRLITANVGSTDTITVDTWTTTPTGTIVYDIFGSAPSSATAPATANVTFWNGVAVSTPATAGIPDINVKNINNVAAATPGASGGVLISGSNTGTTTFGAMTVTGATTHTGAVTMAAGLAITQSQSNTAGFSVVGNGTGAGISATSGSGATGDGIRAIAASTNGNGLTAAKTGTGQDINANLLSVTTATTATNLTNAATAGDLTAAMKTSVGTAVAASAVASVTGRIGIKKNTALANYVFLMTDSTNHNPATGLTVAATRSLDGAAFAACANAVSEISNGLYKLNLAATDTNADTLCLKFTATGADQSTITIATQV